ncbi:adenosine kinase [Rhodobaculum claviforme]|uniref:Adenosine kinase n=1 Tax=Rhodobaculum claviforme TaxID=1549854 RepID=A0A934TKJ1_9RHOB|nr:adenosine kinase [Rhodobaculum claviforme]MBK5927216.1 adenosine kinase [Rhodobaculum claviforme]
MKRFHVTGIGNALLDIISHTDDQFLAVNGVGKGVMQLVDMERAVALYARIGPAREVSGGSAANTIAALAALGGRTAYVGKVKDDQLGRIFAHDLRAQGAVFETPAAPKDAASETGRCIVLVTPDGERSMSTYLGVSEHLGPDDVDPGTIAASEWLYLEGYRFDGADSHAAFARGIEAAKGAGGKVALTLSDPFCVERHRAAFRTMIGADVDLLFANRAEMQAMFGGSFEDAMEAARAEVGMVCATDSENGVHVLSGEQRWHVPAVPTRVVDATGAGDMFAGAFLWGLTHGHDPETSARMGNLAASEVISHIGARAEANLREMFARAGLG